MADQFTPPPTERCQIHAEQIAANTLTLRELRDDVLWLCGDKRRNGQVSIMARRLDDHAGRLRKLEYAQIKTAVFMGAAAAVVSVAIQIAIKVLSP